MSQMSDVFSNLTRDGLEKETESVGRELFSSNIYDAVIKVAYTGSSPSGARYITFSFDIGGKPLTETIYITNREGKNYYLNKSDSSKKMALPGFLMADNICLLTSNKPLASQSVEEKTIKVYDPEQKKEVPTNMPVLVDLLNKPIKLAVMQQKVNKMVKDQSGAYVPSNETREINVIDRVFHNEYSLTCHEIITLKEECEKSGKNINDFLKDLAYLNDPARMHNVWLSKYEGQVIDKTSKNTTTTSGSITGGSTSATPAPSKSLFGN